MDPTGLPTALETVIMTIRQNVTRLRMNVIRSLYLDFEKVANELGNNNLITDDLFEATLGEHGIFLTKSQMWQIQRYFGDDENLNWVDIMDHIRGKTSTPKKKHFFTRLFNHIKADENETIKISEIFEKFDPNKNPKVTVGFMLPQNAFEEFSNSFNGLPEVLDLQMFLNVFQEISIYFFDQEYLEAFFDQTFGMEKECEDRSVFEMEQTRRVLIEKLRNRQKGNESFQQTLIRLFRYFDVNGDGRISIEEFYTTFERMGLLLPREVQHLLRMTKNFLNIEKLYRSIGIDGNEISYKEFTMNFIQDDLHEYRI